MYVIRITNKELVDKLRQLNDMNKKLVKSIKPLRPRAIRKTDNSLTK